MTKALMPGLVYVCGVFLGMEKLTRSTSANMVFIAVGVAIAAYGEVRSIHWSPYDSVGAVNADP
jgi:EamA domain-containing membrane protein RarD